MRTGRSALVTLLLVGCAAEADGDGGRDCISEHPPESPLDVGDVDVASPAPGSTAPESAAPTALTIAAECVMNDGSGCDASRFISRDAASCLAELNGLEAGLEPWRVALVYHHGHDRVVWNVMNRLNDRGREGYSGGVLTLDATDGHMIARSAYNVTP
jgi:hypothetical protein